MKSLAVLIEFRGAGKRVIPVASKAGGEAVMASILKDGFVSRSPEDNIGVWHNPNWIDSLKIISKSE